MAIAVVNSAQTGTGATSSLSLSGITPTAGNVLCCMFSQAGTTTPTLTGWTVSSTNGLFAASADSAWVAYKIASGSETSIAPTGGTIEGICYWELSGATTTLDGSVSVSNNISGATGSISISTSTPGSMVLICHRADRQLRHHLGMDGDGRGYEHRHRLHSLFRRFVAGHLHPQQPEFHIQLRQQRQSLHGRDRVSTPCSGWNTGAFFACL